MRIAFWLLVVVWGVIEALLACCAQHQEGQAMPIEILFFAVGLAGGVVILPAMGMTIYGCPKRWIAFAVLASTAFVINAFFASCAHDNHDDPSNWLNWSAFSWVCGASVTVLSIIAAAFKVL